MAILTRSASLRPASPVVGFGVFGQGTKRSRISHHRCRGRAEPDEIAPHHHAQTPHRHAGYAYSEAVETDEHYGTAEHRAWALAVKQRAGWRCERVNGERCSNRHPTSVIYADHVLEIQRSARFGARSTQRGSKMCEPQRPQRNSSPRRSHEIVGGSHVQPTNQHHAPTVSAPCAKPSLNCKYLCYYVRGR